MTPPTKPRAAELSQGKATQGRKTLESVALQYIRAKAAYLDADRARRRLRCTEKESPEPEVGYDGQPPCGFSDIEPEDYCENCKQEAIEARHCQRLRKEALRLWRQVRYRLNKAVQP